MLDALDEGNATATVPAAVTGPPWAGVLPPLGGWERVAGFPDADALRGLVKAAVAEFRARVEELAPDARTRGELDRIGHEVWSREIGTSGAPVRIVHAAASLGFLRGAEVDLVAAGAWLRLRSAYGSVAVRRASSTLGGLSVSPV